MSEAAMEALAQAAAAEAASGGGMGWATVLLAATAMSTPVLKSLQMATSMCMACCVAKPLLEPEAMAMHKFLLKLWSQS